MKHLFALACTPCQIQCLSTSMYNNNHNNQSPLCVIFFLSIIIVVFILSYAARQRAAE